jgi:chaperone modulatory protein CbpM
MIIARFEFLQRARLDRATLDAWIAEEWLIPTQQAPEPAFSEIDLARAGLIRDLTQELGVNNAGVGVILNLVDQVHGLRNALADVLDSMRERREGADPEPKLD